LGKTLGIGRGGGELLAGKSRAMRCKKRKVVRKTTLAAPGACQAKEVGMALDGVEPHNRVNGFGGPPRKGIGAAMGVPEAATRWVQAVKEEGAS